MAIHHGALPTPFRKEVERLLRLGILNITVSSPTLAQGLNLSATSLLFHSLARNRAQIDIAEFRNVVGRAGRAYVDVEGLVLLPAYARVPGQSETWKEMIGSLKGKEMESGLLRLVLTLLQRLVNKNRIRDSGHLVEYLAGTAAWDFQRLPQETDRVSEAARVAWAGYLTALDTAILGILGEAEVPDDQIETCLDAALQSSLWTKRLDRRNERVSRMLKVGFVERARYIWRRTTPTQRRGYFLSGVGLETGKLLDEGAPELNGLLVAANSALLKRQADAAIASITTLAERVFAIPPFKPDVLPGRWMDILRSWLLGEAMAGIGGEEPDLVLRFVEQALVYRLPWAMEAIRVRGLANRDTLEGGLSLEDVELGLAVAAVETGTIDPSAATLMRAGFSSRAGAIQASASTAATFTGVGELRKWLETPDVKELASDKRWPTAHSRLQWLQFVDSFRIDRTRAWRPQSGSAAVTWDNDPPGPGSPVRLVARAGMTLVLAADLSPIGRLESNSSWTPAGLLKATVSTLPNLLDLRYLGPEDLAYT